MAPPGDAGATGATLRHCVGPQLETACEYLTNVTEGVVTSTLYLVPVRFLNLSENCEFSQANYFESFQESQSVH